MDEIQQPIQPQEIPKTRSKTILSVWIGILLIAVGTLGTRLYLNNKEVDEQSLMAQLQSIRTSIHLYAVLNKTFPPNLQTLITQKYTIGSRTSLYLTGVEVDDQNYPMDPLGHRFEYDPTTGRVWPGTEAYQLW